MLFSGSLNDRICIRELMDTYIDAVNQRDVNLWASTWAEDASWKLPSIPGMKHIQGKNEIVTAWQGAMNSLPFVFMSITVGNIQVNTDSASARSYTSELLKMKDGTQRRPHGQYDDTFTKIDGQWLFQERVFKLLSAT